MTATTTAPTLASVWSETIEFLRARKRSPEDPAADGEAVRRSVEDKFGVSTLDELRELTVRELAECGVHAPLARVLIRKWRAGVDAGPKATLGELRAVPYLDPGELVARFDPQAPGSIVGRQIIRLAKGHPTLVFGADGVLDVQASAAILQELVEGEAPREIRHTADGASRIYRVGEGPGRFRLVHPLDCSPLRSDGTGERDGLAWGALGDDVRAVLMIAVDETGEIEGEEILRDRLRLVQLFTTVQQGLSVLSVLAPEAFVRFQERRHTGGLPPLRTRRVVDRRPRRDPGRGDPARALRQ